ERTKQVAVCPLPVSWSDVGSWDSLYEAMNKDHNQNVKIGNVLDLQTKNSLILGGKKLISTIGLEDILIVDTDDAIFISKKGESQKVKDLVQELVKIGRCEAVTTPHQPYNWGDVKPLYTSDTCSINVYHIQMNQELTHTTKEGISEHWIILSGEAEAIQGHEKKQLVASQSIRCEQPGLVQIKNCSNECCTDVLLITYKVLSNQATKNHQKQL
ncbi:MAG: hypothetical protein LLG04_13080, partial [Parachlamydia sp.]|nr:hypothetical protein [Parachlamydia sp.]